MKKLLALMLAAVMALSLVACGGGENNNSGTSDSDRTPAGTASSSEQPELTSTKWVSLYTGAILELNPDQTMSLNNSTGTWSQDGNALALSYTNTKGELTEQSVTVAEENAMTVLYAQNGMEYYSEENVDVVREQRSHKAGDTISTDIIELTINKADLSYYADENCEPKENGGFFTSNKGHTLVCLDFTIKNTDRADINTDSLSLFFTALQDGKFSTVMSYDLNNPDGVRFGIGFGQALVANTAGTFVRSETSNLILQPGHSYQIRMVGVANFEAEDLSTPFYLMPNIPDSNDDVEKFIFTIQ